VLHCRTAKSFTLINLWAEFIKFLSFTVSEKLKIVKYTYTSKIDVRT